MDIALTLENPCLIKCFKFFFFVLITNQKVNKWAEAPIGYKEQLKKVVIVT